MYQKYLYLYLLQNKAILYSKAATGTPYRNKTKQNLELHSHSRIRSDLKGAPTIIAHIRNHSFMNESESLLSAERNSG